ncbi:hypothetical protein B484DRAFT_395589, partial [Ochromonadaceae sp. CCMP2298]
MAGLRSGIGPFATFYVFLLTAAVLSLLVVLCFACAAPSKHVALARFPIFALFNILYAGIAIYIKDMQSWQRWLPCVSFYRWTLQGLVLNEFQHNSDLPYWHTYVSDL